MIRKCEVLLDNGLNMVVDFDGVEIQLPSTKSNIKNVFVKFEKNKYVLVSESEYAKSLKRNERKRVQTKKEIIDSTEESENE